MRREEKKKFVVLQVIEHTDNVIAQETEDAVAALQVVSVVSLAQVGTTQTVETSSPDPSSPPLSPQPADMVPEEIKEEESGPGSPKIVTFGQNQVFSAIDEQTTGDSFSSSSRVTYTTGTGEFKNASPQYITTSPTRPFSPAAEPQRLPSILEAAMKAEPKVEVERQVDFFAGSILSLPLGNAIRTSRILCRWAIFVLVRSFVRFFFLAFFFFKVDI